MFPFYPTKYRSHALILAMIVVSIFGFIIPKIKIIFWFSFFGFDQVVFPQLFASVVLYQFLHGDILHLLMNSIFLYQAGPMIEARMPKNRFWLFFIGSTLFVAVALAIFSRGVTIGMSGFCMALLSYLWIDLYTTQHPLSNQILIMLVLNIAIGFSGSISLTAHAAGAVWGLIWWYFRKK